MTSLDEATAVASRGDGRFTANLSPEWEIWGPQGDYLASVALRAAGASMQRARPASITAHFVGAGTSAPVAIEVTINRVTRVGTSVSIRITQSTDVGSHTDERLLLTAMVWGVDDDLPGLEHQTTSRPSEVMSPQGLPDMASLPARGAMGVTTSSTPSADPSPPPHPFWQHVEQRPISWISDWDDRVAGEATSQCWYRFVEGETFDDPWLDACRSLGHRSAVT